MTEVMLTAGYLSSAFGFKVNAFNDERLTLQITVVAGLRSELINDFEGRYVIFLGQIYVCLVMGALT